MAAFFNPASTPTGGLHAPATLRNRAFILDVLRRVLPASGVVLEVASGTGEHAAYFAGELPGLIWQPTDPAAPHLTSIEAWRSSAPNVRSPLPLDVQNEPWPVAHADAVVCINMLHISPWDAGLALLRGAGCVLPANGPLYLYGPFTRAGRHTAPSNEQFDARLRAEDPRWGVRDLDEVVSAAAPFGLTLQEVVEMPANNLSVVFRRS